MGNVQRGPLLMLETHDLRAALTGLADLKTRKLASLNGCTVGVSRFSKHPPWERHPAADELLHVLEGELDLTVLTDDGPVEATLRAGSVFVVPRGLWHSPRPRPTVTLLFVTPTEGTSVSWAKDPRRES